MQGMGRKYPLAGLRLKYLQAAIAVSGFPLSAHNISNSAYFDLVI